MKTVHVIAIDGPAGSGKSTVAKLLATELGLSYLDTGAMYRGIAFAAMLNGIEIEDIERVSELASQTELKISAQSLYVDGVDATIEIRSPEVSRIVSAIAANEGVRAELRAQQRLWAQQHGGGVIEGRDIGTVVFPDALIKVYLTADEAVRARRRAIELVETNVDRVAQDIQRRDTADSKRTNSPLALANDAVTVDTTDLTIDETVELLANMVRERL